MGKGALRPFFKGHSLKKEKEHEKKEVDKMLSHFVTLPFFVFSPKQPLRIRRPGADKKEAARKG